MMMIYVLCALTFLQHSVLQASPVTTPRNVTNKSTVASDSSLTRPPSTPLQNILYKASPVTTAIRVTNKSTVASDSSLTRPPSIPLENILYMAKQPFSSLSTTNKTVRGIIVDAHNNLRRIVIPTAKNMLKMKWSDEAAKTAERWAKTCIQEHSKKELRKIPNFRCGENLFMSSYKASWKYVIQAFFDEYVDFDYGKGAKFVGAKIGHYTQENFGCGENLFLSSFKASWKDVIESFYSEVVDFQFGKGAKSDGQEIGHYTQVMWYSSYQVGCYVAECPSSQYQYYYVCHYCPSGNNVKSMGNPYEIGSPCGACPNGCDYGLCTNYCRVQDFYGNCKDFKGSCITDASVRKDCPATCQCNNNEIK
ncbi:serotriflin-like [Bombina bombina]|uniref:serotriflin-like n=1 Tax=Bombina bombina TaxID=8345 RepID=UPI00235AACB9|nr:serotriflin-like [Bombina bombina]